MRLATLRTAESTVAVRVDSDTVTVIPGASDVGELLRHEDWQAVARSANGDRRALDSIDSREWAPVVPRPTKIVCVGLNYANHIREMGRELPEYPTLFAKYPEALIGAYDDLIVAPAHAEALDWEAELAVIVGKRARNVAVSAAEEYIAGYSVMNDVTMRDFQYRTPEWFQGKTFERSAPFGPFLTTTDSYTLGTELRTEVDGEKMQSTTTDDLVFGPAELISYISAIVTLNPGDVIASGTPGGVGHARKPPRYLVDGNTVTTRIEGLGECVNVVRIEA